MKRTVSRPRRTKPTPMLWLGCDAFAWMRLLMAHRFAVHYSRWPVALIISAISPGHTLLRWAQEAIFGRRVARTPIEHGPLFILGHWRSGTTLLHELLSHDPRHAAPTTYECFAPHHFLLSRSWLPRLLGGLMPVRRPMDKMAAGWDRPQEDEFALCLLGQPSPYRRIAFPNHPAPDADLLDLRRLPSAIQRRWKSAFLRLVRQWTLRSGGRRLVLKSPPHIGRIPLLLELFPDARFVHLIRNPYVIYPSTLQLWRLLYSIHALQRPSWQTLPEYVLSTFTHLYERFEEDKGLIPPGRLHELRYEDLIRDPIGQLAVLYRQLDLGDFAPVQASIQAYLSQIKNHETNRYFLTPDEHHTITQRWGVVIQRYGYSSEPRP
jgi:hypothetical protein